MSLSTITALSRKYGSDPDYVLAGGGNTSFKDERNLYIKPSGVTLAAISEDNFVKLDRSLLRKVFELDPPEDSSLREVMVKKIMDNSVCPGESGRPSVESPLHESLEFSYIVHLHPTLVNGLTCGKDGKEKCAELFPEALWIDYVDPGFTLSVKVREDIDKYVAAKGRQPRVIILENHGVFFAANTEAEIEELISGLIGKLKARYADAGVSTELETGELDRAAALELAPKLRSWLGDESSRKTVVTLPPFEVAEGPFSPDHLIYAKSFPLISDAPTREKIEKFTADKRYQPLVISVPGKAVFCIGKDLKSASRTAALAKDAARVKQLSAAFGGHVYLEGRDREFIENWEVEAYRMKVASGGSTGRLEGKIAIVTGGAQGFGLGIAGELAKENAVVAIADMNLEGAEKAAAGLCDEFGENSAFAVKVNITDEESVEQMLQDVTLKTGGLDLFVANAGVLIAGSVKTMAKKDFEFVTAVNYTGYFLCAKHVAKLMAAQNAEGGNWTDIVQINSKSGLSGSNKNGAYAGSKFGTIGLTQSFAMELVEDKIKVNSICPGNYYDGPLWSDPEKGLFVQYLNAGKVPGANTIEEVRRAYESKTPMKRGCFPADVARAIIYTVEQKFETGQAVPVSGGEAMLR